MNTDPINRPRRVVDETPRITDDEIERREIAVMVVDLRREVAALTAQLDAALARAEAAERDVDPYAQHARLCYPEGWRYGDRQPDCEHTRAALAGASPVAADPPTEEQR